MNTKYALFTTIVLGLSFVCSAEEESKAPVELQVLKAAMGVWDAEFEVWSQGPDAPPTKFKGVETNTLYGEHWIASDLDFESMGQTMRIHSIVGYDLDKKQLVGTIIDHGPYAASMTGKYDEASNSVAWKTIAKYPNGKVMVQNTVITQESETKRVLVLSKPSAKQESELIKFMQITFIKRDE